MSERWKKAFLTSAPVFMLLLLTAGWKLAQEPEATKTRYVRPDNDVTWARELYARAKTATRAAEADGPDAAAQLAEAMASCEDALAILNKVRDDAGDPEPGYDFPFEKDYQEINKLLIMCRKHPRAPDAVRLKKPR